SLFFLVKVMSASGLRRSRTFSADIKAIIIATINTMLISKRLATPLIGSSKGVWLYSDLLLNNFLMILNIPFLIKMTGLLFGKFAIYVRGSPHRLKNHEITIVPF